MCHLYKEYFIRHLYKEYFIKHLSIPHLGKFEKRKDNLGAALLLLDSKVYMKQTMYFSLNLFSMLGLEAIGKSVSI